MQQCRSHCNHPSSSKRRACAQTYLHDGPLMCALRRELPISGALLGTRAGGIENKGCKCSHGLPLVLILGMGELGMGVYAWCVLCALIVF